LTNEEKWALVDSIVELIRRRYYKRVEAQEIFDVLDAAGYFEMLAERDALREAMKEKGGEAE